VLKRYRVHDGNGSTGDGDPTEEHAIDSLGCMFESINDEFSVGEISEVKIWD
jgi:hypothetical protein